MDMTRTNYCGAFREKDIDKTVTAMGWVENKRDMGGVIFIDLRDREGLLQVVFDAKNLSEKDFICSETLRPESVIAVGGTIEKRDEDTLNPRLDTGKIELKAAWVKVLSKAKALPFSPTDGSFVREDLRLKYRFLDIRRPQMQKNLRFRHDILKIIRNHLDGEGFVEVETPMLTKSTPEGARDYLVPSRVHPGTFYALPQSPQIFKQLLMVGGLDKYYQIARCFRDEDLRADRQPEFTQVDIEMSFINQEDILNLLERVFKHVLDKMKGIKTERPFPRLTWNDAMDVYGTDKPDLRFDMPIKDVSFLCKECGFSVFAKALENGGVVRAINAEGCGDFTRGAIENLTERAIEYGAKGMAWIAIKENGEPYSILTKYFSKEVFSAILEKMEAKPGDFILFCADSLSVARKVLGNLRLDLSEMLDLRKKDDFKFCIITDFPEFEFSEKEGRYTATHHPFTMPFPEDIPYLLTDPGRVRAKAYDFVLNGVELGSGSLRIYDSDVQRTMFEALGFNDEDIEERFGFMVNAFGYGTPPHGGFAFGLDRLVMLLIGADSLRDVIAFPKNRDGSCPMTGAPSFVDSSQLEALKLSDVSIDSDTVKKKSVKRKLSIQTLADIAFIHIEEKEKEKLNTEITKTIEFLNVLSNIDTGNLPATYNVFPKENMFRRDNPRPSFDRDELLKNAPVKEDGYIYVPKVIED